MVFLRVGSAASCNHPNVSLYFYLTCDFLNLTLYLFVLNIHSHIHFHVKFRERENVRSTILSLCVVITEDHFFLCEYKYRYIHDKNLHWEKSMPATSSWLHTLTISGLLNVDLNPLAQSATVWTHLVCGVQDRLILDTFDTQHNFEAKSRDFLGSTYTDIRMHHGTLSDFFLACPGSSGLDRAQEACWFFFRVAYCYSYRCFVCREIQYLLFTRVTGCEELFGVMSAFPIPAHRFGNSKFEVERGCLVGGRGRYGAVAATCGSSSHRIEAVF